MSQSERERALRALPEAWREGERDSPYGLDEHGTKIPMRDGNQCADELAAALDTPQEPTPAAPPDAKHLPKGNLLGDTANELAKIAEALKTTNALRGREVFEIAVRIGWWANAVKALEAQDAAAPRPALSPDAAASSGDDKGEGR